MLPHGTRGYCFLKNRKPSDNTNGQDNSGKMMQINCANYKKFTDSKRKPASKNIFLLTRHSYFPYRINGLFRWVKISSLRPHRRDILRVGDRMNSNVTNEIMFEVLKQIQADVSHIRHRIDEHDEQFKGIRHLLIALQGDGLRHDAVIAAVRADVDTIKRRLNLSDA